MIIEEIIIALHEIQRLNSRLQEKYDVGSNEWHQCETIDDRIHEVLTKMAD